MASNVIPFRVPKAKERVKAAFIERLLSPLPAHEIQAENANYRYQLTVMKNLNYFSDILTARPNYQPAKRDGITLKAPACEHRCKQCHMECAIAPERYRWWFDQLSQT